MHRSLRVLGLASGLALGGALATACVVTSNDTSSDGGLTDAAPPDGAATDAGPLDGTTDAGPLGFTPSNVDLSGIDLSKVGDFIVDNDECTIDTDTSLASCGEGGGDVLAFKIATQSDGSKVAVYVARSMTIRAGQNLTVSGSLPLVFIALDAIDIAGTLNGNGQTDVAIAGGQEVRTVRSKGAGPGGGSAGTALAAGAGGSYCGTGGAGAAESGAVSSGGARYGTPQIVPLVGGSSGGAGDGTPGSGGGAIQLVAGRSIVIETSGLVHVGAGGGAFGGISGQEASGGGSGGSILLESRAVTVAGTLAANGGGGGAGTSSGVGAAPPQDPGGANATANAIPAAGGKAGIEPSSGGNGSAAASVDGTSGAFTSGNAAGAGGGGAGRIRINTTSGQATLTGTLSPAVSTTCATQGQVR
jgi:hypothetical protein